METGAMVRGSIKLPSILKEWYHDHQEGGGRMSLIIPNLSMPQTCDECPCEYDGYCQAFEEAKRVDYSTIGFSKRRMDFCPLIESGTEPKKISE